MRHLRPFLAVTTVVLAAGYLWMLVTVPRLRTPAGAAALTALVLAHGLLHWAFLSAARHVLWLAPYFFAQTLLIVAFGRLTGGVAWTVQLYLGLVGEHAVLARTTRGIVRVALLHLAIIVVAVLAVFGKERLGTAVMHAVPVGLAVVLYIVLYDRQVRARREAQAASAALAAARERLVEYAGEVERLTRAAERQHLARELHDTLAQGLAGLTLQLEALETHWEKGDVARARAILARARDHARAALTGARTAIDALREIPENAPDFVDAVRREADRFRAASGVACEVSLPSSLRLSREVARHALRCVAEALANVARHARATTARISAAEGDGQVLVVLSDDGVGFDVAEADERQGHYGLVGLRERAELAGGRLEIDSARGAGTVVRLWLPRPESDAAA